jgi:three-Cys-motif partner protein
MSKTRLNSPIWGGPWTSEKLEKISNYLTSYRLVLKKSALNAVYIDAFAGSGHSYLQADYSGQPLFGEFCDESTDRFIEGSPRRALSVEPPFHRYYFIEKSPQKAAELENLKEVFPDRASAIRIKCGDANQEILELCRSIPWKTHRAVLFLDPYGMQVRWPTLQEIAATGAIDLWYLFPLGVGVNRLLKCDGQIGSKEQLKLDELFGDTGWRERFYAKSNQVGLFESGDEIVKTADLAAIERYFIERLRTIFPIVANNPSRLCNSKNNPLFALFFAAGNGGKGGKIALRIAKHILNM